LKNLKLSENISFSLNRRSNLDYITCIAGFEILAFPCNQFGGQEPGSNPEIKQFACARYKAEFPIFDKVCRIISLLSVKCLLEKEQLITQGVAQQVGVNGPSTAPVYQFLKSSAGGFLGGLIKWNLEKFLVDKNSKVVERYPLPTSPFQIKLHFLICFQAF
jgi:glutathione peroxidase